MDAGVEERDIITDKVSGKDLEPKHLIPNMVPCQR